MQSRASLQEKLSRVPTRRVCPVNTSQRLRRPQSGEHVTVTFESWELLLGLRPHLLQVTFFKVLEEPLLCISASPALEKAQLVKQTTDTEIHSVETLRSPHHQ